MFNRVARAAEKAYQNSDFSRIFANVKPEDLKLTASPVSTAILGDADYKIWCSKSASFFNRQIGKYGSKTSSSDIDDKCESVAIDKNSIGLFGGNYFIQLVSVKGVLTFVFWDMNPYARKFKREQGYVNTKYTHVTEESPEGRIIIREFTKAFPEYAQAMVDYRRKRGFSPCK